MLLSVNDLYKINATLSDCVEREVNEAFKLPDSGAYCKIHTNGVGSPIIILDMSFDRGVKNG